MEPSPESNSKFDNEDNFIYRYNLKPAEMYSKERYLTTIMRLSIFEKILTKYIFQNQPESKEYSLYPFLEDVQGDANLLSKFKNIMEFSAKNYEKEHPLYFFGEIAQEILRILKEDDLSLMKFDKYILKIEFLLAWHFENNFYPKHLDQIIGIDIYENLILQKGKNNYVFSVQSINTIEQFIKVFERQSLSTRMENEFPLIRNLFCSEKIYYFYCDKLQREKLPSGNVIKYLFEQIKLKLNEYMNAKVKNYDIENYFMMNFYIINRIIQNFPFYLYKKPELLDIYNNFKILKTWPYPIGITCLNIMQTIINECTFQGISLLNKLRQIYFIDLLDQKVNMIETKYFRGVLILYPNDWETKHNQYINAENPDVFNIIKFLKRLVSKPIKEHNQKLLLRELIIKLFITFLFNSKQSFTDNNFKSLYQKFLPKYESLYKKSKKKENKNQEEEEEEEENEEKAKKKDKKYNKEFGIIKPSLDKLLKIIDVGTDKVEEDFNKEINIIAKKIIEIGKNNNEENNQQNDEEETILDSKAFLPISSFRSYLKPVYVNIKKIYKSKDNNASLDLYDYYLKNFKYIVENYFPYFLSKEEDEDLSIKIDTLRKNFFNNFRINLLVVENPGTINDLLDNIYNKILKQLSTKISDESFKKFWSLFVDKKEKVIPKFLIHVVPNYDKDSQNPYKLISMNEENKDENEYNYLSEFIASVDNIYKNIIFMPFSATCDPIFYSYILNCQLNDKNPLKFPSLDTMYCFLRKPLDYYIGDSHGILNLDIYKIELNDNNKSEQLFWKNIEIICTDNKPCKISLQLVDILGLQNENNLEINIDGVFMLKIFNIFFKKNVPFNYNMTSNNGWLELFLDDKYNKDEIDKLCNYNAFIELNTKTKFYEEFVNPKTEIENKFKNYKTKKILIETNSQNLIIKYDDNNILEYKNNYDFNQKIKKDNYLVKINIEHALINDKKDTPLKIPVATFTTI
jgi:hypothetical protein